MTEEKAIRSTLEDYAAAYCGKDINALMRVFKDGDEITVIGTGVDELCKGREAVKALFLRNFAEATANRFEWHWSDINISGDHAVVAITLTIHIDYQRNQLKVPLRWTVALQKQNGKWVWLHRHASTAAVTQEDGQAYPKDDS